MTHPISRDRSNNFGFLRLSFAILVILSHSPAMIDGNGSREILSRIFRTISFGDVAVDGFFLVSGYLITLSLVQSRSNIDYLLKRVLRIYPGYVAASLFMLFIVGPLAGATIADLRSVLGFQQLGQVVLLRNPELKSAFQNLPRPILSGALWSLAYEFRCYIVLMVLGTLGVLRSRKTVLLITAILVQALIVSRHGTVFAYLQHLPISPGLASLIGDPLANVRCYALFFCGSCFFLFSDKIIYQTRFAILAAVVLLNLMFSSQLAEAAFAVLGGYLLFWFALSVKADLLSRVGSRNDLSFGIYLYAWPIQNLIIWHFRHISPWLLFAIASVVAAAFAYCSWVCVERPFLKLKQHLRFGSKRLSFGASTAMAVNQT
jgi:peptidoglycan/LPS O-acetylase OafA/YrhL